MTPVTEEQLLTALRPVALGALRAIEHLVPAGGGVPTVPVARFDADALRQWSEPEIDWSRMASLAIGSGQLGGAVFGAEAVLAQALGTGPHQQLGAERQWTPHGQVLDAFVADFIRLAITEEGSREVPEFLRDPEKDALNATVNRLHRFLQVDDFASTLVVPLLRAQLDVDDLTLDSGLRIRRFSDTQKHELWSSHGWGSLALSPLPADDVFSAGHVIAIDVEGRRLGGWDWAQAQEKVPWVLLALRLLASGAVTSPWFLLKPEGEFSDYLVPLGVGGGLISEPLRDVHRGLFTLDSERARLLPNLYRQLRSEPLPEPMSLAVRRFTASYQRVSDDDRLIDCWIAFEALFAPDQTTELRYRASLRIARLLGADEPERLRLFDAMRRSYDWRSHLVHGGGQPSAKALRKLGPFSETVAATEDALRRSLVRWADPAGRPNVAEIDAAFLK